MTLVAVDVNATRACALHGMSARESRPLLLESNECELPLAISLEGRSPLPGRAGLALCRRSPHLACTGFLAHLGEKREWGNERVTLDAVRALSCVLDLIASKAGPHTCAAITIPGYLNPDQRALLRKVAEQSRLRLYGTVDSSLAAALTAHAQQEWEGPALVVDVDDHALTWSLVLVQNGSASVALSESYPTLGEKVWKERLLKVVADACVRRSRRDPRDSAESEQALFDHLPALLLASREGRPFEVSLAAPQWYQNVTMTPLDVTSSCTGLMERTLDAYAAALEHAARYGPIQAIVVTAEAALLPGLIPALEQEAAALAALRTPETSEDFGDGLGSDEAPVHVRVLKADAVSKATFELCARWQRETYPSAHVTVAPLLESQSPAHGEARLHYRGFEHPFAKTNVLLGRDPRCDLVFETAEYPSISAQHCRIVYERQSFTLYDLSRHGTLVNDRPVVSQKALEPGDWIRLGPGGPLLRFLGQGLSQRNLLPTA